MELINCNLFKNIKETDIKHLLNCLNVKKMNFSSGDKIDFLKNDLNVVGLILSGKVFIKKLDKNGNYTILETLVKNNIFSNAFTFTITDYNCIEIFACENCKILFIEFDNIFKRCHKACSYHSVFVKNFLDVVIENSKILSQKIQILSNKTIREKIFSYIGLTLNSSLKNTFTLPMSFTSFAEFLCVDRSAMMRELKKLTDAGILKINKKEITILKPEYI